MTLLQQRKLRLIAKRIIRNEKQIKLYLLNTHWLKIRKQKERRRKKTLIKLWKLRQLMYLKRVYKVA
jgi:pyruvate-formate lyase-activating enzyme